MKAVGARLPRYDGVAHVTGRTVFVEDVDVPGVAWVKALRSPHPHAGIAKLDTSAAEQMKGVRAVVTAADVPLNVYGHLSALGIPGDEPLLADKEVRYVGQPIAVVAAEDERDRPGRRRRDRGRATRSASRCSTSARRSTRTRRRSTSGATGTRTSRAASTTARSARATSTPPSRRPT